MVVLVAGQRQAKTLDRIGNEAYRTVVLARLIKSTEQRCQVMAAEIGHQSRKLVITVTLYQFRHRSLITQVVHQPLAPGRTALKGQGRIVLVRTCIDPLAQLFSARFGKCRLLQRAVLD